MLRKIKQKFSNFFDVLYKKDILVYQMGKVGSTSITVGLEKKGLAVKQIHSYKMLNLYKLKNPSRVQIVLYAVASWFIKLAFKLRKKDLKIITLMRDPIARNVSAEFQELNPILHKYFNDDHKRVYKDINICIKESMDLYVNSDISYNWFKDELEYFTGVDILKYEFNRDKGFGICKKGKFEILTLTCEKLKDNTDIIRDFAGLDELNLKNNNSGGNKWYSEIYKGFLNEYCIDDLECEKYYNHDVVKYFYNEELIQSFKEKWCNNSN